MQSMLDFSCRGLPVNYRHRTLETEILKASERFKAVMVSGMRQVGKSTMLQNLCAETRTYVRLDDIRAAELAENARDVFFKQYPAPVLVDEIQRVPELCLEGKKLSKGVSTVFASRRLTTRRSRCSRESSGRCAKGRRSFAFRSCRRTSGCSSSCERTTSTSRSTRDRAFPPTVFPRRW